MCAEVANTAGGDVAALRTDFLVHLSASVMVATVKIY